METDKNREERWYASLLGDLGNTEARDVEAEMASYPKEAAEVRRAFKDTNSWAKEGVGYVPFDASVIPSHEEEVAETVGHRKTLWLRPASLVAAAVLLLALTQVQFTISNGDTSFTWGSDDATETPVTANDKLMPRLDSLEQAITSFENAIQALDERDSLLVEQFERNALDLARTQRLESQARLRDMDEIIKWTGYPEAKEDEWLHQAALREREDDAWVSRATGKFERSRKMLNYLTKLKMKHVVVFSCVCLLVSQPDVFTQEKSPTIEQELSIMSKVLEASLDSRLLKDWHGPWPGRSAFDSRIESDYIPTVGAIFTINVNFPVVKPEDESADPVSSTNEPDDLWEKMSKPKKEKRAFGGNRGFTGIGIKIKKDGDDIVIFEPFKNSPAEKAGLIKGDVILEVEGESVRGMSLEDVGGKILGPAGSKVLIGYLRSTEPDSARIEQEVIIERENIALGVPRIPKMPERIRVPEPIEYRVNFDQSEFGEPRNLYIDKGFGKGTISLSDVYFQEFEYDASRVEALHQTLLTIMARYGHRMTNVSDDERVLLRIVAPPSRGDKPITFNYSKRSSRLMYDGVLHRDVDHLLLSFEKKDLKEGVARENLAKKVKPVTY